MGVTHDSNPGDVPPDAVSSGFYQRATNRQTQPAKTTCPHCGYCRHCGRSGHEAAPQPYGTQITSTPAQWPYEWIPVSGSISQRAQDYALEQDQSWRAGRIPPSGPAPGDVATSHQDPPGTTYSYTTT